MSLVLRRQGSGKGVPPGWWEKREMKAIFGGFAGGIIGAVMGRLWYAGVAAHTVHPLPVSTYVTIAAVVGFVAGCMIGLISRG